MVLPDGVVTFLFTDVEGSTRLWEDAPDVMMRALEQHDGVIDAAVEAHNGVSVKPRGEGDSRFIVFSAASDAVAAVAEMQVGLAEVEWVTPRPVRVRMSLHTGHADLQLGDYYGPAVNRAARLRAIAHGGQVVMSEPTWQLVQDRLPDGVSVVDMGRHGLKDLSRPEHVYQINVEGLATEFAPLKSLDAVPNNLPVQATELIGRVGELVEVDRLLGETRLLTILAPGGTGKTRLAIQAAADHTAEYPDGVFFVSLADLSEGGDIVQAVAAAIGIALASEQDPKDQLLAYLIPRRLLLVFDNFEHLADSVSIVSDIINTAPAVSVIATSRTRLNLTGETTLTLGGLDVDWESPAEALQTAGVQLFVDAAARARSDFSLAPDDIDPLAEILTMTGGMPLAILLAAAWVNMLSVAEVASEIQKSLDFLETDLSDTPDRHRSIRAVFDYTWNQLTPQEQNMFAALSVFRGGFTRQAAETVSGAGLRDLASLTAKSLITADPDSGRYRIHELLRQYAQTELEQDTTRNQTIRDTHATYYSTLCAGLFANSLDDQLSMLQTLEADFDNIRSAWRHSIAEHGGDCVHQMQGALWYLIETRSWYTSGVDIYAEAIDGLDPNTDQRSLIAWAAAVGGHSMCSAILGRPPGPLADAAGDALDQLRDVADPPTVLVALTHAGYCKLAAQKVDEALACVDEGLALSRAASESDWPNLRSLRATFANVRGLMALMFGDLPTAQELLEESGRIFEASGESFYLSFNRAHRAQLAAAQGRTEDAIELFNRSADCSRKLDFHRGLEFSSSEFGGLQVRIGDLPGAERSFLEALQAAEKTSMVPEMLKGLRNLATVYAATDRQSEAVELLNTVLAEPSSQNQHWSEQAPSSALATAELDKLEAELDAGAFEAARAAGASKRYGLVVKELTDTLAEGRR